MIGPRALRRLGVLGMNERNARYILQHNPRAFYPNVDDKIRTKELLNRRDIPTPRVHAIIERVHDFRAVLTRPDFPADFVLKPARGAEGRGILVITGKEDGVWLKAGGERLTLEAIEYHAVNILAGLYSLGGDDDRVIIEYRVKSDPVFAPVAFRGVPDVRLILYRGIPVMSMLRLPTKASDGKANLHQGSVGVGIDMATGITRGGVCKNRLIDRHPDTMKPVAGIQVPRWHELLDIAVRIYPVFRLGYLGIDFVLDQTLGPLVLELNARPGLSIQIANAKGLLPRLEAVDRWLLPPCPDHSRQVRLAFAQQLEK
ncbi:MAG: alpha-L-glutamate ligase-like protein [Candidatus Omnitrophica bacterium]|nr:alpha-L-glutamate ligase-like protein [Candidatus Omnitrophota bacterium]